MSLLTLIQSTRKQIGLAAPDTVVGNDSGHPKQLLALLEGDLAAELRDIGTFHEHKRSHTITLVADQVEYALPEDFDRAAHNTTRS